MASSVTRSCPVEKNCGGCCLLRRSYSEGLESKMTMVRSLLSGFGSVSPILGMEAPDHYRAKVHHVFSRTRGRIFSGIYAEGSHRVLAVQDCLIENRKAQEIIHSIEDLALSFRLPVYDEDRRSGLLRHVLVRIGEKTGQIMVILVCSGPVFPSKNDFIRVLRKLHPEITTLVLNINSRRTTQVLGDRNLTLFGPGYITDELLGLTFRISPSSFYQVNPVQTEVLYRTAIHLAGVRKGESVLDAYCGTGTIGLCAAACSDPTARITGVELNADAIADARRNAQENGLTNARFIVGDAGKYMQELASRGECPDVLFMDPPRSGASEAFLKSTLSLLPSRIVYVSCDPNTLARDLKILTAKKQYTVSAIQPVDMFPFTAHVECVCLLNKKDVKHNDYVKIDLDAEDYYRIKGSHT